MTRAEAEFRKWYIKTNPEGFIAKIPDFKISGIKTAAGLPDYITILNGVTTWYEVKTWQNRSFTPAQAMRFPIMQKAGATIIIWEKQKRGYKCYVP